MVTNALRYSYRRRLLDKDLETNRKYFKEPVLDIGESGRGRGQFRLDEKLRRTNLDIEPGEKVDVVGDAHALPLEDNAFGSVKLTEVLEHVHTPELVIKEIYRVLKKGGYLVGTMPFLVGVHGDPEDYQRFTQKGLEKLLGDKFEIIVIKGQGNRLLVVMDMIREWSIKIKNPFMRYASYLLWLPWGDWGLHRLKEEKICVSGWFWVARKK